MERGQFFQSNRKTRVFLDAVADLTGTRGLRVLLRLAGLHAWIEELPPYDDELGVDFCDVTLVSKMLLFMYGPRGGGGLSMRAGRMMFRAIREQFGDKMLDEACLGALDIHQRAQAVLQFLVDSWPRHSNGQTSLIYTDNNTFRFKFDPCPELWGQHRPELCYGTLGFLQDALEWCDLGDIYQVSQLPPTDGEAGHAVCQFEIHRVIFK
ncbi:MAG: hypothetical protein JXA21_15560 [Anaerolineae bacterium]|nr:hypothetical protein [Anaerolineae bacterium]